MRPSEQNLASAARKCRNIAEKIMTRIMKIERQRVAAGLVLSDTAYSDDDRSRGRGL